MKLKMLASFAGLDFALSSGEETDRFTEAEAKRLISAGYAEKAPPLVVKKPATKNEWDAERERLLAENASMQVDLEASRDREAATAIEMENLRGLQANVAWALGWTGAKPETTDAVLPTETRG